MTNREFYNAIINAQVSAEVKDFAKTALSKLDERNAKRASKPSKVAIANEPIKAAIVQLLSGSKGSYFMASDIATAVDISTSKASSLCRQLVEDEEIVSTDLKVKGKGKVKGYMVPLAE